MPNATLPDIETLQGAKKFLSGSQKKPFFLAVGFQKPHIPLKYPKQYLKFHPLNKFSLPTNYEWPINVSSVAYNPWTDLRRRRDVEKLGLKCPWEKIPKKFAKKIIQSYYAAVTYLDDLIGELLKALKNSGAQNDTIVVLTSDHGWSLGEHAAWAKYSNFEVALRVPLIISIPKVTFDSTNLEKLWHDCKFVGKSKKKCCNNTRIVQNPVELLDVFPTIAELAGILVPPCSQRNHSTIKPDLCSEGSSLAPLIEATLTCKPLVSKKFAISQYPRPKIKPTCEPSSDEPRLKDITIMGYTIRTMQYRYTAWVNFFSEYKKPNWQEILAEELYNHNNDYGENLNLADFEHFQQVKNELKNILIEDYEKW